FAQRAQDAHRDFAAVRDQYLAEHQAPVSRISRPEQGLRTPRCGRLRFVLGVQRALLESLGAVWCRAQNQTRRLGSDAGSPLQAAEQMLRELRVAFQLLTMAETRVPSAPAVELVIPRDGVVAAHRTLARHITGFVESHQHLDRGARVDSI